jgi:hypothetical protein
MPALEVDAALRQRRHDLVHMPQGAPQMVQLPELPPIARVPLGEEVL